MVRLLLVLLAGSCVACGCRFNSLRTAKQTTLNQLLRSTLAVTSLSILASSPLGCAAYESAPSTSASSAAPSSSSASYAVNDMVEFANKMQNERPLLSDEFEITFENPSLGLDIRENIYNGFPVLTVESSKQTYPDLRKGAILTKVGGNAVDGLPLNTVAKKILAESRPLVIRFRDPTRYFELLDSVESIPKRVVTSSYLPANARDAGAVEQVITVERLSVPPAEERRRSSQLLDVMEIQYVATIAGDDSGRVVDSSADHCPPGSSTKTIFYVLGQRNGPPGKFPPGWDLTLRGMVTGEKRRITLPYTLAYERKGDKDRGIPPFASLVYSVKLVSLT